ncbi:AraC family transcriptional regulator [Acinetobacter sp. B10A]|uniref:AraC family transcriptional regulator n=1 Tax=Acinetobacter baretiae TaxID=2605383 RepID=UPI001B3C9266|nr:AraC family transcriptional regulator [Acinetobacter baretiae]MBF7685419.1 AraC family transcriptional regulator [Acinetobacter baretiae]
MNSVEINSEHLKKSHVFSTSNLLFKHQDLKETCKNVGEIFKPHLLKTDIKDSEFSATMHHVKTGLLSLSRLEYGADVHIEPDYLDDFYLIQIPIQGYAEIEYATQKFISYTRVASIISPDLPLKMRWKKDAPQLMLKINQSDFLHHVQQHLPHYENTPIFNPKLDFSTLGGSYFLQLMTTLIDALSIKNHPLHHPIALKQFESSLFTALLYGQDNDALNVITRYQDKPVSPHFIKRTECYMREHLHEPLNIEILAKHAGVSTRTLFSGFKNFLGMTPMTYLKELRLEQAYQELKKNEYLSVTDIAYKWGFTHLGRFSQEYKRRYGELPSSTHRSHQVNQMLYLS